jgi:hypothetical protein
MCYGQFGAYDGCSEEFGQGFSAYWRENQLDATAYDVEISYEMGTNAWRAFGFNPPASGSLMPSGTKLLWVMDVNGAKTLTYRELKGYYAPPTLAGGLPAVKTGIQNAVVGFYNPRTVLTFTIPKTGNSASQLVLIGRGPVYGSSPSKHSSYPGRATLDFSQTGTPLLAASACRIFPWLFPVCFLPKTIQMGMHTPPRPPPPPPHPLFVSLVCHLIFLIIIFFPAHPAL